MIKHAANTKLLRVVKVRVNCKELQKESVILSSSNKITKKKFRGDKGELRFSLKKKSKTLRSKVILLDYYYSLEMILK